MYLNLDTGYEYPKTLEPRALIPLVMTLNFPPIGCGFIRLQSEVEL